MTGEISLRGRVLRVGGIKEKVLAAQRFGIKEVILPEQNKPDWEEAPPEVRAKFESPFRRANRRNFPAGPGAQIKKISVAFLVKWFDYLLR